jgi:hypothetical protein
MEKVYEVYYPRILQPHWRIEDTRLPSCGLEEKET